MKTYKLTGYGNYSVTYGWDTSVIFSDAEQTDEEFVQDDLMYLGRYVKEIFSNEHGGSRNVDLLVQANSECEAINYANEYCRYYYPEKEYMGD